MTCDPNSAACGTPGGLHTFEQAPYNHTCDGHTCDGAFTCDFTVDPRAETCDAADPQCHYTTFDAFMITCNPMKEECRINNPGHCTAEGYDTCDPTLPTCDPVNCATFDPNLPECGTPTEQTTWGGVKAIFR
jgi:hypothetical protein